MLKVLKVFYKFVLKKRLVFAVFVLLITFAQILYSITPYFYKLFVQAIPLADFAGLFRILVFYISVNVTAEVLDIASFWVGDIILFNAAPQARAAIFKHIQDLDFAFHSGKSTGSLISIFKRGDGAFFDLFHQIHHRFLEIIVGSLVMLYFFAKIDIRITALVVLSFAVTILATKFLITFNIRKRAKFNEEEDKVSGIIGDNMLNYETVKLFAKERWEQKRLSGAFGPWKKALWGYGNSFRLIDIAVATIINLSLFSILLVSLKNTADLTLSVGDFVLVTTFMGMFFPKLWNLVWGSRDIAKIYADIQKYFGLLEFEIEVKDPTHPVSLSKVDGEIEFKNVSFSYRGRKTDAIHNFSLKVRPGQSVALVGASGSGKTTLVKLLMRFYDIEKGKIALDKVDIKNLTKGDLRDFIGVVPQEPILFNNTIAFNIGYGKSRTSLDEIKAAARLANIEDFIESLPKKYATEVGERGVKLSGGQKQRLAIARMILSDPKIIIFDEATSHLDSESERLIQESFWKAAEGKTTIIIAHRLSTVMRADKIVVMAKGVIKETGSHRTLLTQKGSLYKHFWDLQIKLD